MRKQGSIRFYIGFIIVQLTLSMNAHAQNQNSVNTLGTRLNSGFFGPKFNAALFNSAGSVSPPVPYQCLPGNIILQPGKAASAQSNSDDDDDDLGLDDDKTEKKKSILDILDSANSGQALLLNCPKVRGFKRKLTCDSAEIKNKEGALSLKKIDKLLNINIRAIATKSCEGKKIDLIYKELNCLQSQGQQLQQFMNSMGTVFFRETQKYSKAFKDFSFALNGLAQQQQEVALRLNGNPATGEPGIVALEAQLVRGKGSVSRRIAEDGNKVKKTWNQIEEAAKQVNQTFEAEVIQGTESCFRTRVSPVLKCLGKGGKKGQKVACSRQDKLLEKIRQNALVDKNGRIKRRAKNKNDAETLVNLVEAVLNRFYGETAKTQPRSNDSNQINNFINGKFNVVSLKEIHAYFRKSFAGIKVPGINLTGFVSSAMGGCYNFAFKTVQRRSTRKGSQIDILRQRLKSLKFDADRDTDEIIGNYEEDIQKVYRLLGRDNPDGSHFVPPPRKICKSSTGKAEVSCVKQYGDYLNKLVRGSHPDSTVTMVFAGNQFVPDKIVPCAGLAPCKTKLQAETTTFVRTVNRVRETQADFGEAARNSYTNYVQQIAQQIGGPNGQNAIVTKHLKDLQRVLAQMGVRPGLKFKTIKPEVMKFVSAGKGPNGEDIKIPAAPNSPIGLVSGLMGSPMLDMAGSNFGDSVRGLTKKQEDLKEEITEISEASDTIEELKSECAQQILADHADELKDIAGNFKKYCAWMENYFGGKDTLSDWARDLRKVAGVFGGDIGRILRSGVSKVERGELSSDRQNQESKFREELKTLEDEQEKLIQRTQEIAGGGYRSIANIDENLRTRRKERGKSERRLRLIRNKIKIKIEKQKSFKGEAVKIIKKLKYGDQKNNSEAMNDFRAAYKRAMSKYDRLETDIENLQAAENTAEGDFEKYNEALSELTLERNENSKSGIDIEKIKIKAKLKTLENKIRRKEDALATAKSKKSTGQQRVEDQDCDALNSELTAKRDQIIAATKKFRSLSEKAK